MTEVLEFEYAPTKKLNVEADNVIFFINTNISTLYSPFKNMVFIGHPPARETSQDGQYALRVCESRRVRNEKVDLTSIPGRAAGRTAGAKPIRKLSILARIF